MPHPEPLQIFLHIPKAAGSTLQSIIFNNYRPEEIYWVDPDCTADSLSAFADMTAENQQRIRVLAGHMAYGVHKLVKLPCQYFTMLRDPVERIISMYHYIRTDPKHFIYNEVCAMNLHDFVESRVIAQFDNGQTRILDNNLTGDSIGSLERADYKECTAESLERAKENLQNHFVVVGISEKFNASLLLFKSAFGWRDLAYAKKNVSTKRPARATLPPETINVIEETNKYDLEIYRYAKEVFGKAISARGMKYRLELMLFNLLQALR